MKNTIKSTIGFFGTLIEKYTPLKFSKGGYEDVYNYVKISEQVASSGQPTAVQFESIRNAGFETVINLLPANHENSLPGQDELLQRLGFEHIYIPVNFRKPTEAKFDKFVAAMEKVKDRKVWVHCAANMRVTAFLYRYRRHILGEDGTQARADMEKIWTPFGVWKGFVA